MRRYKERPIKSMKELRRTVEALDLDEGIRLLGKVKGFSGGGFIFITKGGKGYCVNICERIRDENLGDRLVPGGRERWYFLEDVEEVVKKVKEVARRPLRGWAY